MLETNQPPFHRLFVALCLPNGVKAEIAEVQGKLRKALPDEAVRWTRPEHFHLTLSFLGNVAIARIDALADTLRLSCRDFAPLQLRVERIGFFPERGFPRVIWTAVSSADERLASLQGTIQSATLEFTSEPAEKKFTGHITLGRAKRIARHEAHILANFAEKMQKRFFGEWIADTVELFKSELLPGSADHKTVATIPLGRTK